MNDIGVGSTLVEIRIIGIFTRLSFGDLDTVGLRLHGQASLDFAVGFRLAGGAIGLFFFLGAAVRCWGLDLPLDLIFLANLLRRVFALLLAGLGRGAESEDDGDSSNESDSDAAPKANGTEVVADDSDSDSDDEIYFPLSTVSGTFTSLVESHRVLR